MGGSDAVGAMSQMWRLISFGVMPLLLAFSGAFAITAYGETHNPVQVGNGLETPKQPTLANLMSISPLPQRVAPGFTLVDQAGRSVSLISFRGKAVLLAFMDSRCTQVCPLVAQELISADRDLGRRARDVVFVGVNVNPSANSVADIARFTQLRGLGKLNNWYFLTGSLPQLERVWRLYGIEVIVPRHSIQTIHSSYIYFLSPSGRERFLADATVLQRQNGTAYLPSDLVDRWGKGLARYISKATT
ncbi:MAG: SCO family protein [Hyphomicrobiales bacterium]